VARSKTQSPLPRIGRAKPGTIDAARYSDPGFLDAEIERVFRRSWVVACRADRVGRTGSFATLDRAGVHVVVTRDQGGTLRAFRNACRHRGSRLARGRGRADSLTCTHHGWRYGLDGHLDHLPMEEGFDHRECADLNLMPVRHSQFAGLIWVNLDPNGQGLSDSLAGIDVELAPYRLEEMRSIEHRAFRVPVNWKLMLENALDFYHIERVHQRSVSNHIDSRPELAIMGDHSRQNLPIAPYKWRKWIDARCSRGGPYDERQQSQLFKYMIFPNTMLNVLPYHLTVMAFWPDGPNHTYLHYSFCRRSGSRGIELARVMGTWLASRFILWEDVSMLERCLTDLDTDAVPTHHLHQLEAPCAHLHEVLDKHLG
jgi:phenylpropionate dioxygenase-like ring-hydroxylating dioxygenase large terminal subunit